MTMKPPYATWADYCEWKGLDAPQVGAVTPPTVIADLRRAARAVDSLLVLLKYDTDASKFPTDPAILADFVEANCIQYEYFLETGDPAAAGDYAGVKTQRPGPETIEFLRTQGYLNSATDTA